MDKFTASNGLEVQVHQTSIGQRVSVRDSDPAQVRGFQKPQHVETYLDPRQADALREYFEAHPKERKDWEDAKPGEAWELTIRGERMAATVEGACFWVGPSAYAIDEEIITAARRIYPEVS